jgi:hypothetical protein
MKDDASDEKRKNPLWQLELTLILTISSVLKMAKSARGRNLNCSGALRNNRLPNAQIARRG